VLPSRGLRGCPLPPPPPPGALALETSAGVRRIAAGDVFPVGR
jgi:hypothetical protein